MNLRYRADTSEHGNCSLRHDVDSMPTHRFPFSGSATVRTVMQLASQLRALPADGEVVVDCEGLTQCDAAALQLLVALGQRGEAGVRVERVPEEHVWRFRCVGITPVC